MRCLSIGVTSNVITLLTSVVLRTVFLCKSYCRSANGDVLVITCEGNCGFYETGIISTPLTKGYSVLGWNHPGFASSTVSITACKGVSFIYFMITIRWEELLLLRCKTLYCNNKILPMLQLLSFRQ